MALRPILRFPHPKLRTPAEAASLFDADLRALATDLLDTMRAAPGIGITAPHVGVMLRLVVLELSPDQAPRFYVNPEILEASTERIRHMEGSVSLPGAAAEVERSARVKIRYQDLEGASHEEEAEGLLAICHQHEIDQLNGVFWLQRLSKLRRDRLIKAYEKRGGSA